MIDFEALKKPFPANSIEWRIGRAGETNGRKWATALAYLTSRAVQDRLDEVCKPQNWKNEFKQAPEGGILCGISLLIDNKWVTKWDGADQTKQEAVKGGLSGAFKRAAVLWGIGRYLYALEKTFVDVTDNGKRFDKFKDKETKKFKYFKWNEPTLPKWALPEPDKTELTFLSKEQEAWVFTKIEAGKKPQEIIARLRTKFKVGTEMATGIERFCSKLKSGEDKK